MPVSKKQMLRFIRLVDLLKSDKYPNCSSFAKQMRKVDIDENINISCTPKTVYRDILALKDDFGAPIEFDHSRNGYYLTDPNWDFPIGDSWRVPEISAVPLFDSKIDYAVIRCDHTLAEHVREKPLHSTQEIIKNPDGTYDMHIKNVLQSQLISWVMCFAGRAYVISPEKLRTKIFDISTDIQLKHKCA